MISQSLLDSLRPSLRPALWCALADLSRRRDSTCSYHDSVAAWNDFINWHYQWRDQWSRTPQLAAIGFQLLDRSRQHYERQQGCLWLSRFPSVAMVEALANLALDDSEPIELRNSAVWLLGSRQVLHNHPSIHWPSAAVELADTALMRLWRSPQRDALSHLLPAFRHVHSSGVLDVLSSEVVAACAGLEAFATPKLATALVDNLERIPAEHAPRIVRLIGSVLGRDVVPRLLSYAEQATLAARVEGLMAAVALDPQRAAPSVESYLSTLSFDRVARARVDWHMANPGVFPTVNALAVARCTAEIEPLARADRCRFAAGLFAQLAAIEPFYEEYLNTMWSFVVLHSRDDAAVTSCVQSGTSILERAPYLLKPYLLALARSGKFESLSHTARTHGAEAQAVWLLATHARPFMALALRKLCNDDVSSPESVAGGALALFLAGRPDLTMAALERDLPRAINLPGQGISPYPGPDEQWRVRHEPEECPALVALDGGFAALLSYVCPVSPSADSDKIDFDLIADREKDLRSDLVGMTVCLVGEFVDKSSTASALESRGARVVDGPFGKTDYYLVGANADSSILLRLRSSGVRELTLNFGQ